MSDVFPGAKLMQLVEWGYPMGRLRAPIDRIKAFSTIHITAIPDARAEDEAAWRQRDTGLQNSATFFLNRNGSAVQCLGDPARMDPWANGDMRSPDTSNPRIADLVRSGLNANQRTLVAIENVGNEFAWRRANGTTVPGGFPITAAQEATCARIVAHYHRKAGVPITRETVIGHYQLNSVTRRNCPSADKSILDRIVRLAVDDWHDNIEYVDPFLMTIRPTAHRRAPDLTTGGVAVLDDPVERIIVGKVRGVDFGAGPDWWVYISEAVKGHKVIHSQDELSRKALGAAATKKQIDDAKRSGFLLGRDKAANAAGAVQP